MLGGESRFKIDRELYRKNFGGIVQMFRFDEAGAGDGI
jgi:hypothetical protein